MSDKSTSNRRKTLLVNPEQQKRLILTMSLIPTLGLSATMVLICYFCHNLFEEATKLQVYLDNLMPLFLAVSGFVLVSGFFMISNALMISHKIAGPSYRVCKSIEQICAGDVAFKVHFRKGDHLVEVRDRLNDLLDVLNENPPEGFRTRAIRDAEVAAEAAEEATEQATTHTNLDSVSSALVADEDTASATDGEEVATGAHSDAGTTEDDKS